ncbi:MAG: PspC domain-containing protein [Bacteroidales bacterium]|nr:PspC domain-containing protein [Bacteroidales bacterium]
MSTTKRLYRNPNSKVFGGVCTGLGDYFNVDYTIIRLAWLVMILFGGIGLLAYIIAWIIIPKMQTF